MKRAWRGALVAAVTSLTIAGSLMALHGCGGGGGGTSISTSSNPPSGGSPPTIINTVNDETAPMGFAFTSPVTVKSGTTVQWKNLSNAAHSIVWDSQTPGSSPPPGANIPTFGPAVGDLSATWVAPTVTTQTTYAYHCGIHGPTMNGVIIVNP